MHIVAGIDVSKESLDVCLLEGGKSRTKAFPSSPGGIRSLVRFLAHAEQVVMEATGSYHVACARALVEAGLRVCVANPAQASHFAKARLRRNKTDKVDAAMLALMALEPGLRAWEPDPAYICELQGLVRVRDDLVCQLSAKKSQSKAPELTDFERAFYAREIQRLNAELRNVGKAIREALQAPELEEKARLLLEVPGVGEAVCPGFLALMPVGISGAKQAAAFCGLTPRQWESGQLRGQTRISKQGDPRLRRLLYIAATHARKDNGPLQAFYERMLESKRSKKSALCALAHKLARILWAVSSRGIPYDPSKLTMI